MFARIGLFADDVVGDLAERAADKLRWGVDAGHLELFLVRRGGEDEPTLEEEAAALNGPRLGATVSLERAGIEDGICLLAKITAASAEQPEPGAYFLLFSLSLSLSLSLPSPSSSHLPLCAF